MPFPSTVVASTDVVVGTTVDPVLVATTALPSLVVVKTVVNCTVALVVICVNDVSLDALEVLTADEETSVAVTEP